MQNKNIDSFYDYIDQACMILHQELGIDYLDALIRVANDVMGEVNESMLSEERVRELQKVYYCLNAEAFMNEEIRLALQLLIIKALKHVNYPVDLMTPDSICFIIAYLINQVFDYDISLIDLGLGTSNLSNAIANFFEHEVGITGIENNSKLVELAKASFDLQNNRANIYLNDYLMKIHEQADVIVGDLDANMVEDKYIPYLVINQYLDNLTDVGWFFFVIENDFFNKPGIQEFKNQFAGSFLGLIVLPQSMFKQNHQGKSILVGTKKQLDEDLLIINMPSLSDQEGLQATIDDISEWINKMKGMIK